MGERKSLAAGLIIGLCLLSGLVGCRPTPAPSEGVPEPGVSTVPRATAEQGGTLPDLTSAPPLAGETSDAKPTSQPTTVPVLTVQPEIVPANAGRVVEIARLGNGAISEPAWSSGGQTLAVGVCNGVLLYDRALVQVGRLPTTSAVRSVAFSRDGRLLSAATESGEVWLWDTSSWQELRVLSGDSGVKSVVFSADSRLLVVCASSTTVWDIASGQKLWSQQDWAMSNAAISSDGNLVASGNTGRLLLRDARTGEEVRTLEVKRTSPEDEEVKYPAEVKQVFFSPDGAWVYAATAEGSVRVWVSATGEWVTYYGASSPLVDAALSPVSSMLAMATGQGIYVNAGGESTAMNRLEGLGAEVTGLAFSPDETLLAITTEGGCLHLWRLLERPETLSLSGQQPSSIAFSGDGQLLASGSRDGTVVVWSTVDGRSLQVLQGHTDRVNSVAFSPDKALLLSGSSDTTMRVWEVATGREVRQLAGNAGNVTSVAMAPNGQLAASGTEDGIVSLWDVGTGQMLWTNQNTNLPRHIQSLAFSADSHLLAAAQYGPENSDDPFSEATGEVLVLDVAGGQPVQLVPDARDKPVVAFSPTAGAMAVSRQDNAVQIWDTERWQVFAVLVSEERIESVSFASNGLVLAVATSSGVDLWRVDAGQRIQSFEGRRANLVGFSANNAYLVSGLDNGGLNIEKFSMVTSAWVAAGYSREVNWLTFLPNPSQLAAIDHWDKTVRWWDLEREEPILVAQMSKYTSTVALAQNGSWVAMDSPEGISIRDVVTGRVVRNLQAPDFPRTAAFSADGRLLAAGYSDNTVWLWDISSGRSIGPLRGHADEVTCLAFSPNNVFLASGSLDNTVRIWKVETGQVTHVLEGHTWFINALAFSPDSLFLASASEDRSVRLWDVINGGAGRALQGLPNSEYVYSVAFSPDGRVVAAGLDGGDVWLLDAASGQKVQILHGHRGQVNSLAFSPDNQRLVSGSADGTIVVWGIDTSAIVEPEPTPTFTSLGPMRPENVGQIQVITQWSAPGVSLNWSPDGQQLVSGGANGIHFYEAQTFQETGLIDVKGQVQFTPGGRYVLVYTGQVAQLREVATGAVVQTFSGFDGILDADISPDGRLLAAGGNDGILKIWGLATSDQIAAYGQTEQINSVAFSPDGTLVATGSGDQAVHLWDVATGQEVKVFSGQPVFDITFSPDGQLLAIASCAPKGDSGCEGGAVWVWDVATGEVVHILEGHSELVWVVDFSPDGALLASGSFDHTIRIWNVKTGQELRVLQGHSDSVTDLAFSPDGTHLASGSAGISSAAGAMIIIWGVPGTGEPIPLPTQPAEIVPTTPTPLPLPVQAETPVPSPPSPITAGSVGHVREYARAQMDQANGLAWSPDSRQLAVRIRNNGVILLDARTLSREQGFLQDEQVGEIAFSPDGKRIAIGYCSAWPEANQCGAGAVAIFKRTTGEQQHLLEGHTSNVYGLAFSPDGWELMSGASDGVRLWSAISGSEKDFFQVGSVSSLAYSADGTYLAFAGRGAAAVLDLTQGVVTQVVPGTGTPVGVAFSPSSEFVAATYRSNNLQVWRVSDGEIIYGLNANTNYLTAPAYSPDGTLLAAGDALGNIFLWDANSGRLEGTLTGHTGEISRVAFSPDGYFLASVSWDGTVRLWGVWK